MRWTTKCCPREPSDYDIGVLTSDGIYSSLKNLLVVEYGNLDPSPRLATGCDLPSSPSWHLSLSTSVPSIVYERMQDQPDITRSDDTPVHSSVHLIAPGRMEGHTTTLPIPITSTGRASSIQSHSEPYTSELSFALLPGHSSLLSQSYGTPTVGTPEHLPHPSPQNMPAVSQAHGGPLCNAAPDNSASLARCISAQAADAQQYLRPTISAHSTPQVHVISTMQTPQTTFAKSWDDLDFPVTSVTPMSCSTSFSPDCALIRELEQHHDSGFTTPSLDLKEQPQSNGLSEEGVMDEYWQLNGGMRSSPMYRSRGLSPIDMGVYELPGISEGGGTANNFYDACLFSNGLPVTLGC